MTHFDLVKKYAGIYVAFLKASLVSELEFRFNLSLKLVADIFWYIGQILIFEVIFKHTPQVGGWSVEQMRVFLGLVFIADGIYMLLWHENFNSLSENVRKGHLDLLLVKPINSQFMVSSQKMSVAYLGSLSVALGWFVWSYLQLPHLNRLQLLWLVIMLPASLSVIYFIRFSLNATSIIFTRADSLQFLWFTISRLGHRPDRIYPSAIRYAVLFFIPVGMLASAPARVIMEPTDYSLVLWALVLTPLLFKVSSLYWNFCLSKYSSASS